ncbi:unnamed protein product, partial [Ectocarpus sp. 4 AP-2014]
KFDLAPPQSISTKRPPSAGFFGLGSVAGVEARGWRPAVFHTNYPQREQTNGRLAGTSLCLLMSVCSRWSKCHRPQQAAPVSPSGLRGDIFLPAVPKAFEALPKVTRSTF